MPNSYASLARSMPACRREIGGLGFMLCAGGALLDQPTVQHIDLAGDRVDSMFPPGQIESNDQIDWQGISGLSPSLNATNLAAEARNSEYSFFAGVLYGLGLSLIFAFVQICLSDAAKQRGVD